MAITTSDLVETRIKLHDQSEILGYLTGICSDSLSYFDPNQALQGVQNINFDKIDHVIFRKNGTFWEGASKIFLISESVLLLSVFATISDDDYFGRSFFIVLGNMLIVAPLTIIGGATSVTPKFKIAVTDPTELKLLHTSKLANHTLDVPPLITITPKAMKKLGRLQFPSTSIEKRSQLNYTPKAYIVPFGVTLRFNATAKNLSNKIDANYKNHYLADQSDWSLAFGFTIAPFEWLALEYRYLPDLYTSASFDTHGGGKYWSATYNFSQTTHQLSGMYRLKPYYNGMGNYLQFSVGGGVSLLHTLDEGYLYSQISENEADYSQYSQSNTTPGFSLSASADWFLSKNVSLQFAVNSTRYASFQTQEMVDEFEQIRLKPININTHLTALTAALQFQL